MRWHYPLCDVRLGAAERSAVSRVIRDGWLTMGPVTEEVEAMLRARTGARYAALVSSGTAALEMAAEALEIGPGDEVICPSLTFVASANAFRARGAAIVFARSIGENDLTVDPDDVARKITPRTRALVVVHYAGFPARMAELRAVAREKSIALIEDCAHALFTRHEGRILGTFGAVGCFSFFSNKNITCGEGGAVITHDPRIARRLQLLRSHGMTALTLVRHRGHAFSYDVRLVGHNYRPDELRAALLRTQLSRLDGYLAKRRALFREYVRRLSAIGLTVPFGGLATAKALEDIAVHLMVVLLPSRSNRRHVMTRLRERGIQTSIHYPPVHRFHAYRSGPSVENVSGTERIARRLLTLPLYPRLGRRGVADVVNALSATLEGR
jgi:dTDP-4-amino-4,6-dideoxygalactose transaminase